MFNRAAKTSDFLTVLNEMKQSIKGTSQRKVDVELSNVEPRMTGQLILPTQGIWSQRNMVEKDLISLYALGTPGKGRDLYYDKNAH